MTAAYVVLNHSGGPMIRRLVTAVRASSPASHVFVTHDARRARTPRFDDPLVRVRAHGLRTDWGSWELVAATLDAFAWARDVADPDLVVLVSGQDYPARRLDEWEQESLGSGGWIGEADPLRYRPRWGRRLGEGDDDLTRYTYRWFRVPSTGLARHLPPSLERTRVRVRAGLALRVEPLVSIRHVTRGRGTHLGIRRRRTPFTTARPCMKGTQWIAMDRPMLDHLLAETAQGSPLRRYFRRAVIPDEALAPTVLSAVRRPAPGLSVSYVDWSCPAELPRVLDLSDLDAVRLSRAAFCRKVDPVRSVALLDALDHHNGVR